MTLDDVFHSEITRLSRPFNIFWEGECYKAILRKVTAPVAVETTYQLILWHPAEGPSGPKKIAGDYWETAAGAGDWKHVQRKFDTFEAACLLATATPYPQE